MTPSSSIWLAVLVLVVCTESGVTSRVTRENFPLVTKKQSDSTTKRILRVTLNDDVEERMPVAEEIARVVEKASVSGAKTVEIGGEKTGEKLFEELQAGGDVLETHENPNLNALIMSYVAKPQEKPSIKYFLDKDHLDVVANALFHASLSLTPTTKKNAEELLVQLLEWHATKETSAAEFFNLLKLPHDENAFVKNEFVVWGRYATLLNENGRSQETYIEALISMFGGEKKLVEAIWKGKEEDNSIRMKRESRMIESSLFEKWESEASDPYSLLDRQEKFPASSGAWRDVVKEYMTFYNEKNNLTKPYSYAGWKKSRKKSRKKEGEVAVREVIAAANKREDEELETVLKSDGERPRRQSADAVETSTGKADDKKPTNPTITTTKGRTSDSPENEPQVNIPQLIDDEANERNHVNALTVKLAEKDLSEQERFDTSQQLTDLYDTWYNNNNEPADIKWKYFRNNADEAAPKQILDGYGKFYDMRKEKDLEVTKAAFDTKRLAIRAASRKRTFGRNRKTR